LLANWAYFSLRRYANHLTGSKWQSRLEHIPPEEVLMSSTDFEDSSEPLASTKERRVWLRYPCELDGFCQPPVAGGALQWAAKIEDVSSGGIAISAERRFELGALLSIEIQQPDGSTVNLLARVVRVIKRPGHRWLLGCTLAKKLAESDLRELI
jgi:PilZ domain-containing protein